MKEYIASAVCLGLFESITLFPLGLLFFHLLEMDLNNLIRAESGKCLYLWSRSDLVLGEFSVCMHANFIGHLPRGVQRKRKESMCVWLVLIYKIN